MYCTIPFNFVRPLNNSILSKRITTDTFLWPICYVLLQWLHYSYLFDALVNLTNLKQNRGRKIITYSKVLKRKPDGHIWWKSRRKQIFLSIQLATALLLTAWWIAGPRRLKLAALTASVGDCSFIKHTFSWWGKLLVVVFSLTQLFPVN